MDIGWIEELLQMYFTLCETELLGKDLVLEDPESILAALVPLCCLGCKWAASWASVGGAISSVVMGTPTVGCRGRQQILVVEWHIKSELWKGQLFPL